MYTPRLFMEERIEVLHQGMMDIGAATIVGTGPDGLTATHAPMVVDPDPAPYGALRCHFARANPHADTLEAGREVLVIFQGPQGYVSPSWYPSKQETGEVVPTWNYVAIHAHGIASIRDDSGWLKNHLMELTDQLEKHAALPWKVDDAPEEYIARLRKAIVGVEIKLTRIEGKWKLSQNRPEADRLGVVAGLRSQANGVGQSLATLVEQAMKEDP